jgi:hypothetical protein
MTDQPRYCERCGSQIRPTAKFCPQCGAPQGEEIQAPPGMAPPGMAPPAYPAPSPVPPTQVAPSGPDVSPTEYMPPPPAASQEPFASGPAGYPPPPQAPRRNRACLILAVVALVVLLLACCLIVGLGLLNYQTRTESTPTPTTMSVAAAPLPQATAAAPGAEPTLPAEPPPAEAPGMKPVDYANVHFQYSPELAAEVIPESIPANADPNGPTWELAPQHTVFNFSGYPLHPEAFHEPRIYVYPVDEYRAISPEASGVIDDLRAFLDRQPAQLGPDESIPFLPMWNAAQVLQAKIAYLEFQNGRGVRFLTQYAQNASPVNNRDLFYTFQGLTHDARYYLTAVLPVANPLLDGADAITIDDDFINNFTNYIVTTENDLGGQPPESFTPNLDLLDDMLRTFRIE